MSEKEQSLNMHNQSPASSQTLTKKGQDSHLITFTKKKQKKFEESIPIDEHKMTIVDIEKKYSTSANTSKPSTSHGLTTSLASERFEQYGPNAMTPAKEIPMLFKYLKCLSNLFNILLLISGCLCYITYAIDPANNTSNLWIGGILFLVALINAFIEFFQEQKSVNLLKSFMNMVPQKCYFIRDGKTLNEPAINLVPGDICWVRMGDKVPADLVIFWASDFKVDNSSLTGESEPLERTSKNTHENVLEATNMAFFGSMAMNGEAYGIVVRTGDHTVLGQIASMASSEKKQVSPMTKEIDFFVHVIAAVAGVVAIVFFAVGWVISEQPNFSVRLSFNIAFAIGVFVSFVPEGLPMTMVMLLSIAAQRMSQRNVLVKDLRGVETLGAITCLATDKTGTLTRNKMTVTNVWTGNVLYDASLKQKEAKEVEKNEIEMAEMEKPFTLEDPNCLKMVHAAYLCSKVKFDRTDVELKKRNIIGDATESGLFLFASQVIPDSDKMNDTYPKVFEIPFNSTNKWHLTIHKMKHSSGAYTLLIKGAPERIINLCSHMKLDKLESITDYHKGLFNQSYELLAAKGHRVIGVAMIELNIPENYVFLKEEEKPDSRTDDSTPRGVYPKNGYTFLGLFSLEDPPKHGVREAIGTCRQAGIKVMMVTGDHPLTAEAIARKINLMVQDTRELVAKKTNRPVALVQPQEYNAIVVHGEMIDKMTEEDWERVLDMDEIIFARTSPKHKLQIVKRCQARGHIVGVTGDGVNDSPALKKADLGISMNISGSDVSKEAAAMILLDDNFASTVSGIAEGRLIFNNLKKSIRYTITHTMPQVVANLAFLLGPIPLPLGSLLIIMVDLGFEIFIAVSYAWEVPETKSAVMCNQPRKPVTHKSMDYLNRQRKYYHNRNNTIFSYIYGYDDPSGGVDITGPSGALKLDSEASKFKMFLAKTKYSFTHLFDKEWWSLAMEPQEETVLVDKGVLSWAYLEFGVLEATACMLTYYYVFQTELNITDLRPLVKPLSSPRDDTNAREYDVWKTAQSSYYFGLFVVQLFNYFLCKVTIRLPWGRMLLRNRKMYILLPLAFGFTSFIIYPSFMNIPFDTRSLSPKYWWIPLVSGVVMLFYGTLRIWIARKMKKPGFSLNLPLDLHPTRWSTVSQGKK